MQGSVQRVHERVRVNIQVIRVTDGTILWSNSYVFRQDLSDIFQVQDAIAAELAQALALTVSGEEQNCWSSAFRWKGSHVPHVA